MDHLWLPQNKKLSLRQFLAAKASRRKRLKGEWKKQLNDEKLGCWTCKEKSISENHNFLQEYKTKIERKGENDKRPRLLKSSSS